MGPSATNISLPANLSHLSMSHLAHVPQMFPIHVSVMELIGWMKVSTAAATSEAWVESGGVRRGLDSHGHWHGYKIQDFTLGRM